MLTNPDSSLNASTRASSPRHDPTHVHHHHTTPPDHPVTLSHSTDLCTLYFSACFIVAKEMRRKAIWRPGCTGYNEERKTAMGFSISSCYARPLQFNSLPSRLASNIFNIECVCSVPSAQCSSVIKLVLASAHTSADIQCSHRLPRIVSSTTGPVPSESKSGVTLKAKVPWE